LLSSTYAINTIFPFMKKVWLFHRIPEKPANTSARPSSLFPLTIKNEHVKTDKDMRLNT